MTEPANIHPWHYTLCPHRLGVAGAWPCVLEIDHAGCHVSRDGQAALSTYDAATHRYDGNPIDPAKMTHGPVPLFLLRWAEADREHLRRDSADAFRVAQALVTSDAISLTEVCTDLVRQVREAREQRDALRLERDKLREGFVTQIGTLLAAYAK